MSAEVTNNPLQQAVIDLAARAAGNVGAWLAARGYPPPTPEQTRRIVETAGPVIAALAQTAPPDTVITALDDAATTVAVRVACQVLRIDPLAKPAPSLN